MFVRVSNVFGCYYIASRFNLRFTETIRKAKRRSLIFFYIIVFRKTSKSFT